MREPCFSVFSSTISFPGVSSVQHVRSIYSTHKHVCSLWPTSVSVIAADDVVLSCPALFLIAISGPRSVTVDSADESSSSPTLADTKGL